MLNFIGRINKNHVAIIENMIFYDGLTSKTQTIMAGVNWYFNLAFLHNNGLIECKAKDKDGRKIWTATKKGSEFVRLLKECDRVWLSQDL